MTSLALLALLAPPPGPTIRITFAETDVAVVLRAIASQMDATILYANKEKVPVTVNLKASSVDQAVRFVASAAGMAYRRIGATYVVAPPATLRQALEPFSVKGTFTQDPGLAAGFVAPLQAAFPAATVRTVGDRLIVEGLPEDVRDARIYLEELKAREIEERSTTAVVTLAKVDPKLVEPVVQGAYPGLKVVASANPAGGGLLALTGSTRIVAAAKIFVRELDVPTAQETEDPVEMTVYELRYTSGQSALAFLKGAIKDVDAIPAPESLTPSRPLFQSLSAAVSGGGAGGGSGGGQGGQGQGGTQQAAPSVGLAGAEAGDGAASERVKRIVLRGRRAAVAKAIELLTRLDAKPRQVVVECSVFEVNPEHFENIGATYTPGGLRFFERPQGTFIENTPTGISTLPLGIGTLSRTPFGFEVGLNALVRDGQAKVLARPRIQVIDNDSAHIFIGETLRVPVTTVGALGAQQVQIQEFPVGIILLLVPRVNANGDVTLRVNPVISAITSVSSGGIPQTTTREAQTSLVVKDGETIVLGGLIRDEEVRSMSRVPLLSQIPLLGELFKNRTRTNRRTEIVVSLTTRVVREDGPLP